VTAEALRGNGGNIQIVARERVTLVDSLVTAQAMGSDGARITIDPEVVILRNSVINGLAGGRDVPVEISAGTFVRSADSRILSDAVTAPVEVDIAGSLSRLPGGLGEAAAVLSEVCGVRGVRVGLSGRPVSSFVTTSRGGTPVQPGGFMPSLPVPRGPDGGAGPRRRAE
jgi:hypothetical protein